MLFPFCWRRCQARSQSDVISLAPAFTRLTVPQVRARHTGGTVRKDGIASDALFSLKRTLKQGRDLRLHDNVRGMLEQAETSTVSIYHYSFSKLWCGQTCCINFR